MDRFSKALSAAESFVVVLCMASASGVLFANVVLRYAFQVGLSWAEEFIIYSMIWMAFVGSSICVRKKCHVAMRLVVDRVTNERVRKIYEIALIVFTIVFSVVSGVLGIRHLAFLIATDQTSPALQIPMYVPYLAIPIGFALMTLHLLEELYSVINPPSAALGLLERVYSDIEPPLAAEQEQAE